MRRFLEVWDRMASCGRLSIGLWLGRLHPEDGILPHSIIKAHPTSKENSLSRKRIGILTGGGDVPGLNSVIKTVVYRSSEIGCEVIGLRRGWEALTHVNLDDDASRTRYVQHLDRDNTRTIDRTGGTYLHSSRTNPSKMKLEKLPLF